MELLLVCRQCGYEEHGSSERALIAKVRMLNHLNRAHPEQVEAFKQTVEEKAAASH